MSELSPLLAGSPDELEALLLRSAEDDEPGDGALEQAGIALGLGASALAAMSATSALASGGAALTNAAAKPLTLLSLAKWLGVGITAGLVTGGAAHLTTRAPETPSMTFVAPVNTEGTEPRVARAPARAPAPESVATGEIPLPAPPAPVVVGGVAAAAPTVAVPAPLANTSPGPSSASFEPLAEESAVVLPPASTLGDETRALDRVREHLAAGRPAQALAEIQRYRAKWTRGALAAEATLLRIDALLRAGNRSAAELEANGLIARAPQSRYATRARTLLGSR